MVSGIEYRKRKYVEVVARFDENGDLCPLAIIWEDGRRFDIRRQATSLKVGGNGLRFIVRIGSQETYLFYENPKWYVEAKVYESSHVEAKS